MKIKLTLNGELYAADMSGSDLEVTMRLFGKLTKIRETYIGGQYRMVQVAGSVELRAEVVTDLSLISPDEAESLEKEAQQDSRRESAANVVAAEGDAKLPYAKGLWRDLYHSNVIDHSVYKAGVEGIGHGFEPESSEHEVVDYIGGDGSIIRVNKDGSVEKFPAHKL